MKFKLFYKKIEQEKDRNVFMIDIIPILTEFEGTTKEFKVLSNFLRLRDGCER